VGRLGSGIRTPPRGSDRFRSTGYSASCQIFAFKNVVTLRGGFSRGEGVISAGGISLGGDLLEYDKEKAKATENQTSQTNADQAR